MTDLQAIADCKEHWKRMIAQVEVFINNKDSYYNIAPEDYLKNEIGETPYREYCELCKIYSFGCYNCPLYHIGEKCSPDGAWEKVVDSTSWPEWKHNAETYMLPALDRAEEFCLKRGDKE